MFCIAKQESKTVSELENTLEVRKIAKELLRRYYRGRPAPCDINFESEVDELTIKIMNAATGKQNKGNE